MKMTDRWNRIVYRLWAPVYDAALGRFFLPGRRRAMQLLAPRPGERLLLVGIGTGADLGLLPAQIKVIGTDLSPEMLGMAVRKLLPDASEVLLARSDAALPMLAAGSMDAALMSLILSVVPDGRRCLESTLHALRPGARIVIFDKFLPGEHPPGWLRRLAGQAGMFLGTDINRRLSDMTEGLPCKIQADEPSIARGMYRVILLTKIEM